MAGYTRQSLAQILNGEIVSAPPLNAEFNQILSAFNNSTGHKHDGTAAEGPPIDRIADLDQNNLIFVDTSANQINFYVESSAASVGQISIQDGAIVPFTDNDIDLGSSSFEFKDLYIDGTANIDTLAASLIVVEAGTAGAPSITTTGDVDNGLYFNAANQMSYTSGGVAQVTFKDGSIVPVTDNDIDLGASGAEFKDLYIDGTANIDSLVADTVDINGGTIDNTVIGATTPAAATFTNLTVSTGSTINFSGATVSNGGTFTTVTISGGTITGITDLAIADGGTGASTASAARTNLGVAIGTNVQAYDAGLQSISGLTTTADQMIYTTSSDTYATASLTSAGRALLDDASASAQRTTLGLGTLATQDANSVAITGGTISGISNISDPGTSLPYTFSTTTTDSDPGSGIVRFNNATQNAATEIYIDDEDNSGANVSGVIALLAGGNNPSSVLGYVTIRKEFAPENFITMKITTLTSASGYTKLVGTVEASSGATPFSDTDNLYFSIDVSGDKGDPGDISGPGSSTDNAVVRWDGTSGGLIQDSSVVIDDSGNVGIGTTSPSNFAGFTNLQVNGSTGGIIQATTGATTVLELITTAAEGRVGTRTNTPLVLKSNNTERARIDTSGNVGIGTSSPSALLDVNGTTRLGGAVSLGGDLDMSGYDLTVDFSTIEAAGEHAEENDANATGTITIQATDPTVLRRTLTGDVTLLVAGAPTPGKGWSTELRTTQDGTGGRDLTILPVNQLTYSADLQSTTEAGETRPWTDINTSLSLNAAVGPDGRTTLTKLIEDADGGISVHARYQVITGLSPNQTLTVRAVVKDAGDGRTIRIQVNDSAATGNTIFMDFDPSDGSVDAATPLGNATLVAGTATPLANNCYLLTLTGQPNTSGSDARVEISPLSGGSALYTGDGTSGFYIGNVQVNTGQPVGMIEVGATRAASVVWRGGTAAEIDYAAQAAAAESRIIIGVGSDGEILIDDVSVEV
jgi:hypothetical protein